MHSRVEDDCRYGLVITIEMVGSGHRHCDVLISRANDAAIDTVRSECHHQHVLAQPHRESSSRHSLAATLEMIE